MANRLSTRIKHDLRITLADFCKNNLKTDYRTFQYRMRKQKYYPAEVIYICWLLDDKCENIFGKSFSDLVLLQEGPGDTVAYVKDRLAKAADDERVHLMELIGMSAIISVVNPPLATSTTAPEIGNVEVDITPEKPKIQDAPKSFEFIDIDLTRGNVG